MSDAVYTLDASSIINFVRHYPRDIFTSLWSNLDELAKWERLLLHQMVVVELDRADDRAAEWARSLPASCRLEIDNPPGSFVTRMAAEFPHVRHRLQAHSYASSADPFIVAAGFTRNLCVVTDENPRREWKIPNLCHRYGVVCLNRHDLMRAEGWVF